MENTEHHSMQSSHVPKEKKPSSEMPEESYHNFLRTPPLIGPLEGRTPTYEWRGIMLDTARTYFDVATIIRILQLAARYGFNRLQWHLTDDAGWRFSVPEYPKLTEIGAFLPRSHFDDYNSLAQDTREITIEKARTVWKNGYYSDEDISRVVETAHSLGITIVPELDFPGHMTAAIQSYPEFGRPSDIPLPEGSMREDMWWPARNDLLWPTDKVIDFLKASLRKIIELFPHSPIIHVGGDECVYKQWSSDPGIGKWLKEHGYDNVLDLHTWFISIARGELEKHDRTMAGWDEVCQVCDDDSMLLFSWDAERGQKRIDSVKNSFVFADARSLYLNRIDPHAERSQTGMVPPISVEDILKDPWQAAHQERCVGVQASFWSEFILGEDDLLSMMYPRLLAVAEKMWTSEVDVAEAQKRIEDEYAALKQALADKE